MLKNKVIHAHKEILGRKNAVFLDIFLSQPLLNRLKIEDLDSNAVENFINYLYNGTISNDDLNEQLYMVADKYLDPIIKDMCRKKFAKTLSIENVSERLAFFFHYDEIELMKQAKIFIARNYNDIKTRPNFNQVLENEKTIIYSIFDLFGKLKISS